MSYPSTESVPDPRLAEQSPDPASLYPPSFIDRLTKFLKRRPVSFGLTYLLLFILETSIILVLSWLDGWLPAYEFNPIVILFPAWLWGPLAFISYLDSLSLRAFSEFAQLLKIPDEMKHKLAYEFTTMPARSVIFSSVAWAAVYLVIWYLVYPSFITIYGFGSLALWTTFTVGFISFTVGSAFYYHTFRQLRLVSRIVGMVDHFDLFNLDPVYAFSVLTSRTGICWVILSTLTILAYPVGAGGISDIVLVTIQVVLGLAAFLLPLRAVNRRLVEEKRRQQAALDQRVKATLIRLHQLVDEDSLKEVSVLNDVLRGLASESEILTKIPIWPWRPGFFTGFVSVILLPILLSLIQLALGRFLGN